MREGQRVLLSWSLLALGRSKGSLPRWKAWAPLPRPPPHPFLLVLGPPLPSPPVLGPMAALGPPGPFWGGALDS